MSNNELNTIVANKEFTYGGKFGGSIDFVAGSDKAQAAFHQIMGNSAVTALQAAAVAAAASFAALGSVDAFAVGAASLGGLAGGALSANKDSSHDAAGKKSVKTRFPF